MAKTRAQNEIDINSLYGCPGAEYDSSTGGELLKDALLSFGPGAFEESFVGSSIGDMPEALQGFGLKAFTDSFIAFLAARHRTEDYRSAARYEAAARREARGH